MSCSSTDSEITLYDAFPFSEDEALENESFRAPSDLWTTHPLIWNVLVGPAFHKPSIKHPLPLQNLAAQVCATALGPGVLRAYNGLQEMSYPRMLLKKIIPHVILNEREWEGYVYHEFMHPCMNPDGVRRKRIFKCYAQQYPHILQE